MTKKLFEDRFLLLKTNKELEDIKLKNPELDEYYLASACSKERRELFEKLWKNFEWLADKNFLKEVQTNFQERSWEMYIGNVLLEKGLKVNSKKEGPDFFINNDFYLECVSPTKGDPNKPDSVPEPYVANSSENIRVLSVPIDQIILRICSVIHEKGVVKYNKWKNKKWFNFKSPLIIAINTGGLGYPDDYKMPYVLKTLFGFQWLLLDKDFNDKGYSTRINFKKNNNKDIFVDFFTNDNYSQISGILFSNQQVLNHPKILGDDCYFINNPFAENQVPREFIKLFKSWDAKINENIIEIKRDF